MCGAFRRTPKSAKQHINIDAAFSAREISYARATRLLGQDHANMCVRNVCVSAGAQNGPKQAKTDQLTGQNGPKQAKMVQNRPKWSKIYQNGPKQARGPTPTFVTPTLACPQWKRLRERPQSPRRNFGGIFSRRPWMACWPGPGCFATKAPFAITCLTSN